MDCICEDYYKEEIQRCKSCNKWIEYKPTRLHLKYRTLYFHKQCLQKAFKDSICLSSFLLDAHLE